ncbi:FAD-dependent oxidoreductase [[Haemophilus] ducreyi]|uniref:FAD-dependent oxidoreductase n=1 Tax=Haemophilus ducreyi TaxID=730 RepID=UPI0006553791|nr:FAD-dependent oxidoreductase [[Haemophilus] ducreyi]AKO45927.1 2-octaprenyl-3-methyl-6-methoxy-1,4-benzoquinol hydroxylase [[Haemophilus] ducreyi]AKO47287.1 2-octaprenyl-3-methyl-6-methoxy-1,4-benzoquinol hydroxylase [[Haemophilus] ducreyi]AKO48652.1 2-octaprenyl-3-methyl-6-methoxy-1,4-benzoquinol hydroxylase [[Haemophilus] ducreyi]AKO50023.1 2-octaprenyl-3-methyl-6-methoxy-1,4-benzoquinol hydroxylase [[Haemophilus] ducreyi]ANF61935.1 2-octaprenyl-3-methyl-6-methoxy-1,4-benzoquinol hydroxyl
MKKDVIIIGGGMVGAATALGLAKLGLNIALIEKKPLPLFQPDSAYDLRISAISIASVNLLAELGVWQQIQAMRVCRYDSLETWEVEGFSTRFTAEEIGLDTLGFMVENKLIQMSLWQALNHYPNCQQIVGFTELTAEYHSAGWTITVDDQTFSTSLIIAADGANSQVRHWAGIGLTSWQYRQHCLLATVKTALPTQSVTWQQFFPTGPRAFLPLADQNGCVVWYDAPQRVAELTQLSPEQLALTIMQNFPARLGEIEVIQAGSFPLTRQHAQHYTHNGVVLIGDAAHTINPLAGQGVNLGFKDVKVLLEVIRQALEKGPSFADEQVLKQYQQQRKADNLIMQTSMDLFYKAFKSELLPVKVMRNLALMLAEKITPLKKQALKYAIGLK